MSNESINFNLNESQKEAVTTDSGYVRVIAGAGSGKTRVLTERIAYLLREGRAKAYEILAITFTNKAAAEMRERIEKSVGADANDMWVMTYHSFCARILRFHIHLMDYDNNYVILDAADQKAVLKDLYKKYNLKSTDLSPALVLSRISNYKMAEVSPLKAQEMAFAGEEKQIAALYADYDAYLSKQKVLDFDDLLIKAVELFTKHPDILEKYATRFKFIHVDEFQDTNDIQFKLVEMLSNVHGNLYIVGDPDQSIYSWRGANDDLILNFDKQFDGAHTITLEQNYRSTQNILDAANRLITHNEDRLEKELFSEITNGAAISVFEADDEKNEADFIATKLKGLMRRSDDAEILGNSAVLYRANYLSRAIEEGFMRHGLPYIIYGDTRFLDRMEIKDMLSYMQLVLNPNDDIAFKRVVNQPKRNVGVKTLEKLEQMADTHGISLFDALSITIEQAGKGKSRQLLVDFEELIHSVRHDLDTLTLAEVLDRIYVQSGYKEMLEKDALQEARIENILELEKSLGDFSKEESETTTEQLSRYLQEMALLSSADKDDAQSSVSIMTVHAAKGLEFENIFIIGLNDGIFPAKRSVDEGGIEEERRLAYVAITRAKKRLFVSYPNGFNVVMKESKRPSQFLFEANLLTEQDAPIFEDVPVFVEKKATSTVTDMSFHSDESAGDLSSGDKVRHKKFGEGVIVSIDSDRVTVAFSAEFGVKTLVANFIEKI